MHGCWIDATQDEEIIYQDIQQMLSTSPTVFAEEWAIHDYEGFGSLVIEKYADIKYITQLAQLIQKYGDVVSSAVEYYGNIKTTEEALANYYYGEWSSELEFATELFNDLYNHDIPETIRYYIDYEMFSQDIFIDDYFSLDVGSKVHVFSSN